MMGIGLDEEEGENADNESLASYFSGLGYDHDHIPTRDTGEDWEKKDEMRCNVNSVKWKE